MTGTTPTDEEIAEQIADLALSFYPADQPLDWDDLLDRAEKYLNIDLGNDMTSPTIRRIQRHVRQARREARE